MRRYETIYILRPNLSEDEITSVIDNTNQIIVDQQGTIIEQNKWGMKKLAYLIKKETQGYYVYSDYATTPDAVAEIERKFRIDDAVLKYMTIKTAASISDEQIQQAVGEVTARDTTTQETVEADKESEAPAKPAKAEEKTETAPEKVQAETTEK